MKQLFPYKILIESTLVGMLIKVIMTASDPKESFNFFMAYIAVWSGAKIVEKLLDVLLAKFGGKP